MRSPESSSSRSTSHYPLLDWLRFLAALLVVFCHARPGHWVAWPQLDLSSQGPLPALLFLFTRVGHEAVVIFFVLSGYLVGGKLICRCAEGTFSVSDYTRDRFSRIFIPLVPAILLTVACVAYLNQGLSSGFALQLAGNFFQLQGVICLPLEGNNPLWSLSYEVWFYALAGAMGVILMRRDAPLPTSQKTLAAGVALFAGWCLIVLDTTYLLCWLLGAFAYWARTRPWSPLRLPFAFVLVVLGLIGSQFSLGTELDALRKGSVLTLASGIALMLPQLSARVPAPPSASLVRLGPHLAAFSYTLYLTHFPLLLLMRGWHEPHHQVTWIPVGIFFLKVGLCVVAAWFLYLPFERNTDRIRRLLRGRQTAVCTGRKLHA